MSLEDVTQNAPILEIFIWEEGSKYVQNKNKTNKQKSKRTNKKKVGKSETETKQFFYFDMKGKPACDLCFLCVLSVDVYAL